MKKSDLTRRDFLKIAGAAGLAVALGGTQALNTSCSKAVDEPITKTTTTSKTTTSSSVTTTSTTPPTASTTATPPSTEPVIIDISSNYASPALAQGKEFMWINEDDKIHTVTNDEYYPNFDFTLAPHESVSYKIDRPGLILYYCKLHDNENAEIVVT